LNILEYKYNPCKPFTGLSINCQSVAVCQGECSQIECSMFVSCIGNFFVAETADERFEMSLGGQETATWSLGLGSDENPIISYSTPRRTTHVILQCSTNGSVAFEFLSENPEYTYTLRLTHKCACWNGCSSKEIVLMNFD